MFLTLALAPPPPSVSARASRAMLLFLENDQPMLLLIGKVKGEDLGAFNMFPEVPQLKKAMSFIKPEPGVINERNILSLLVGDFNGDPIGTLSTMSSEVRWAPPCDRA